MSTEESRNASSRVLRKLQLTLNEGKFYEAHQLYRTLYFRYLSQKKYATLLDLLYDGAMRLFAHGQLVSATDLSELYADSLGKTERPMDQNILFRVEQLFAKIPPIISEQRWKEIQRKGAERRDEVEKEGEEDADRVSETRTVDRSRFATLTMNWSKLATAAPAFSDEFEKAKKRKNAKHLMKKFGHPTVHQRFATVLWAEKDFQQARHHFMLSQDAQGCAGFLIDYQMSCGYSTEVDLFVVQAVLQFLCRGDKLTAGQVFHAYTEKHPQISGASSDRDAAPPPYHLPLLNFLWLLLLTVDIKKLTYYTVLVEVYMPSLQRDSTYVAYLDKIGQIWFGLPPPVQNRCGPGGFMANFMQSLIDPEDEHEEEEEWDYDEESSTADRSSVLDSSTQLETEPTDMMEEELD